MSDLVREQAAKQIERIAGPRIAVERDVGADDRARSGVVRRTGGERYGAGNRIEPGLALRAVIAGVPKEGVGPSKQVDFRAAGVDAAASAGDADDRRAEVGDKVERRSQARGRIDHGPRAE